MTCPYCGAKKLVVLEQIVAVIRAFGQAKGVKTWWVCYGCRSSVALNVAGKD